MPIKSPKTTHLLLTLFPRRPHVPVEVQGGPVGAVGAAVQPVQLQQPAGAGAGLRRVQQPAARPVQVGELYIC